MTGPLLQVVFRDRSRSAGPHGPVPVGGFASCRAVGRLARLLSLGGLLVAMSAGLAVAQEVPAHLQAAAPPSAEHFREQRDRLREAIGEGIVVMRGSAQAMHMGQFGQDQDFYWLSGVSQPQVAMLLGPATDDQPALDELLVPPYSPFTAMWDGAGLAPGEKTAEQTGFVEARNSRGLHRRLDALLAPNDEGERPVLWVRRKPFVPPGGTPGHSESVTTAQNRDRFDGRPSRDEAFYEALEERYPEVEIRDVTPVLHRLRARKTAVEIALLRESTEIAAEGLVEVMRCARPGLYEYQLAAIARYVFSLRGAGPDAYAAIVGAGANGCILHYKENSAQLQDGDLIVMDYAATLHGYASDVTRTFPANGKFTAAQRKLVEDVYDVQQELIRNVRPGASLSQLTRLCSKLLIEKGYRSDHGPSHHVGLAVHDPSTDRLEPGMVLTVEPGAYLRQEGMGCRIEDVVLVTEDGHEVLSAMVPSKPDEIERLMAEKGVVEIPVGVAR
ncbi:MAG: aminopeptidase P N-terminal domain-containing protein [Planctomycetota bacterium]|nr:aminopeptidase P N-terminal domain-containing protein [Planctomycetota bacterium]